ncbi:MAG TPA: VWA domain-containing protein [Candidatus Acidoferrales bacterium]|jgi:VWFA-related protein|nr:VWA domain-containing protein [Candidatus Acidoferrales bacterium]
MKIRLNVAILLLLLVLAIAVRVECRTPGQDSSSRQSSQSAQVTVPARPAIPLFKGQQGKQQSAIAFSSATRKVTIALRVEDPNGYFIPNLHRDNFAVYEDSEPQKNVDVEIEHSPVSVALLMEFGGRYHELDKAIGTEVAQIGRQFLDVAGPNDKIAAFKYGARLDVLSDFGQNRDRLNGIFDQLGAPEFSEVNLYDAVIDALNRTRVVAGRRAIIAISTGLDTFSKATFEQALQAAQDSATPIYSFGLISSVEREVPLYGPTAPFAHIDWAGAEKRLEAIARASGGRAYAPDSDLQVSAIYDDIMENLRVRYMITYISSNTAVSGPPRKIRVELVDPKTGEPLEIHDAEGRPVTAKVYVQETYSPGAASGN